MSTNQDIPAQNVPPDMTVVPNFYRRSIREAARIATEAGLVLESKGSGFASGQNIEAGSVVEKGTKIHVEFNP